MSTIKVTEEIQREIDRYRHYAQESEYTLGTSLGYSTYLSRFLRESAGCDEESLQDRISSFFEAQRIYYPKTFTECRAALHLYFKMVTGKKFPKLVKEESNPEIEANLKLFYDYSINIQRIKASTAKSEVAHVRRFLESITTVNLCKLDDITAYDIRDYVIERMTHLSDSSKGTHITAIRNFFRFQKFEGMPVHESIFTIPLSPAVWRSSAFPTTIDEEVFNSLAEVPCDKTPTGKRNRCIILCFTELALRCTEVAALTIDDFNWYESYVSIKNTKNHSDRKLPVSEKLGEAVVEYIQTARPKTTSRVLFVRFKHIGGEPMGCSQIRGVVRRVYGKSGAEIESTGPHILRRTAATKLYNAGNSLKMTADILGHESLDSTVRYTKADIAGLRQVAFPWLEAPAKAGDYYVE